METSIECVGNDVGGRGRGQSIVVCSQSYLQLSVWSGPGRARAQPTDHLHPALNRRRARAGKVLEGGIQATPHSGAVFFWT